MVRKMTSKIGADVGHLGNATKAHLVSYEIEQVKSLSTLKAEAVGRSLLLLYNLQYHPDNCKTRGLCRSAQPQFSTLTSQSRS